MRARRHEISNVVQRLKSKVALVTGGARGLGKAIAQRLKSEGAIVVITDLQDSVGAGTAAECGFAFIEHDVTRQAQWAQVTEQVERRFGALHILVNNAGIVGPLDCSDPEAIRLADWQAVQRVNVDSAVLGCRAVIPLMRRSGGGSIINISSIAALLPGPDTMAYAASKAAVRHVTTSVAVHCARTGSKIRCNSVHPGVCLTALVKQSAEDRARRRGITVEEVLAEMKSRIPQGEFIDCEDVANAVLFLASDEARHITGAKLVVDGGQTCG